MNKNILYLLIVLSFAISQVSVKSTPKSFLINRDFTIQEIILPDINVEQIIEEERIEQQSNQIKPYKFVFQGVFFLEIFLIF